MKAEYLSDAYFYNIIEAIQSYTHHWSIRIRDNNTTEWIAAFQEYRPCNSLRVEKVEGTEDHYRISADI